MPKKELTIAVSGLNATDNPAPGVPVIRSVREGTDFNGTIVGLAYDRLDPGIYMDGICDHVYLMPYPSEGADVIFERIKYIHEKTPIDVIIPTLDAELNAYIKINDKLIEMGIHTFLPTSQGLEIRSKANFEKISDKLSIRVPKGKAITEISAIYELEKEFSFPIMVKGQFYGAHIAYSPMEVEHYFKTIASQWGLPVVVQEFIVGEEYDVVALGDGEGRLIGSVPIKKMQLTDKGKAWGGITIHDPKLDEFVKFVIKALKWRGPCEVEVIKNRNNDQYYLIEINPRFPAWVYFSVGVGQNLPAAVVSLALGNKVDEFTTYKIGAMFLRNSIDMIYSMDEYQEITTAGEIHKE